MPVKVRGVSCPGAGDEGSCDSSKVSAEHRTLSFMRAGSALAAQPFL